MLVEIRGAGDIATGIALRLHRAGCKVVMCDLPTPTSIRRTVCFSEAIRLGECEVEGVRARLAHSLAEARTIVVSGEVAVLVDPEGASARELRPAVLVDAILAKRNLGTTMDMAPVVIGVGPGFSADRVLRAPADGVFEPVLQIGDVVRAGQVAATVAGVPMTCTIDGVLRGLLQAGVEVTAGMKSGDIDPRCERAHCFTASDKARAVGGGVLEAICMFTSRLEG